ncbi:hypothetical protein GCM10007962_12990 [Yeosuana aromativorans]|uniref:Uncharacterized protein n=1 Tax=Yeosuana aromativorans TaxID=288019 RepID=A0A8J3BGI0_9FLAO|nr:DUF6327 family protein [Yeosuana aromativorans]GGK20269.1 hypothetical protein GCM10007962_12990 [Yeosuana aromativorans]
MKNYQSFHDIEQDLKRLKLERHIALEEMKLSKNKLKDNFYQNSWLNLAIGVAGKYGFYVLLKRFIK